jgi:hypothetical protein
VAAGPDAYGQKWRREVAARANTNFPASSVYVSDMEVFAFHLFDGASIKPMQYDVSSDGGETFPVMRKTAFNPAGNDDVFGAALITLADGTRRILLLLNASQAIAYSDTVFTLPLASTWTQVQPTGNTGAPVGFGVRGLNVVVCGQAGGSAIRLSYSLDGGATFSAATVPVVGTVLGSSGFQLFASPIAHEWCFLNPQSGSIYRSADDGNTWGAAVTTIVAGNAAVQTSGAIWAVNATRIVAVYKGQVVTSDDAGLTWTVRQNLTLNPPSTTAIGQGAITHLGSFGINLGVEVLGGVTPYVREFNSLTTRGAMWRSLDLGTTWTLIDAVGGAIEPAGVIVTGFVARNGRGVMDLRDPGSPDRYTWFNPNPPPEPAPPAVMGPQLVGGCSSFTVCPCPSTCD